MTHDQQGPRDLGPPPKPVVDWQFTPRPGRALDAANLRLANTPRPGEARLELKGFLAFLIGRGAARLKNAARWLRRSARHPGSSAAERV